MRLVNDFTEQLSETVLFYLARQTRGFITTVIIAIMVAALCWLATSYYTRLWNLRFRATWRHHLLCTFAALATLVFGLLYQSLSYMKQTTEARLLVWEQTLDHDASWARATFAKQYDSVLRLKTEDFTDYPSPARGGSRIPISREPSRVVFAEVIVEESLSHFRATHPFLGSLLHAQIGVPADAIRMDINDYFDHPDDNGTVRTEYPNSRGIALAATRLREDLFEQTPTVVRFSRFVLLTLFLIIQFVVFAVIGLAAYNDLKVVT